ncbi:MAG: hypothetical protein C5B60_09765 [Chloroflexi bacterium]|nr:MAG: hypothetical protein C5B60_09765 [Chloroflexota bacterium]
MSEILAQMGGAFRDPGMSGTLPPSGPPFRTQLSPDDEIKFQQWTEANNIPTVFRPGHDFDLRGFWRAMMEGRTGTTFPPRMFLEGRR